ncbi:MAG: hypothetical protein ACLQUZ_12040 [Rhizomicrobium sp.]
MITRTKSSRGTATSAIWNTKKRERVIALAPIVARLSQIEVRHHATIFTRRTGMRMKLARL